MGQILSHLDPSEPWYLGTPSGTYINRFAKGGSCIVLSGGAVESLYQHHNGLVHQAEMKALKENSGDVLIASTLQKLGIFLDERFAHFFNGESPIRTRIWSDRFCTPLVSFHGLKKADEMAKLGAKLRDRQDDHLTFWGDVWSLFDGVDLDDFDQEPIRENWDFVGRLDGRHTKTSMNVDSAERCMRLCMRDRKRCLAWSWDERNGSCSTAPWMVLGQPMPGKKSGVNARWAAELLGACRGHR